jgi:hypothetical protein
MLIEENLSTRKETCQSATLYTINPAWTRLGLNQILRD